MSVRVTTNADQLATRMRHKAAGIDRGMRRGLRNLLIEVERGAVQNLSGSGEPGSYPVPRRTGTLAKSMGHAQRGLVGDVFNTAGYAEAIHEGWSDPARNIPHQAGRPFLTDAVESTDAIAVVSKPLRRELHAR